MVPRRFYIKTVKYNTVSYRVHLKTREEDSFMISMLAHQCCALAQSVTGLRIYNG